jgi:hypothetical protein
MQPDGKKNANWCKTPNKAGLKDLFFFERLYWRSAQLTRRHQWLPFSSAPLLTVILLTQIN